MVVRSVPCVEGSPLRIRRGSFVEDRSGLAALISNAGQHGSILAPRGVDDRLFREALYRGRPTVETNMLGRGEVNPIE